MMYLFLFVHNKYVSFSISVKIRLFLSFSASNDLINPETVIVEDYNATSRPDMKIISWDFPKNPNGELLAFRVKIWQGSGNVSLFLKVGMNTLEFNFITFLDTNRTMRFIIRL